MERNRTLDTLKVRLLLILGKPSVWI